MNTEQSTSQETSTEGREKLVDDLKTVMKDAEDLLRGTGQQMGRQMDAGYRSARERFESTLQNAKISLSGAQGKLADQSKDAMEMTQKYVQENPWQAVGIGALAGVALGILLSRK
jgi:ElaB/YqjD/DUF883 family membrane-anchored ribosome-binding protein